METENECLALLKRIADTLDKILSESVKPKNIREKVAETILFAATVAGFLSAIDLILRWIGVL